MRKLALLLFILFSLSLKAQQKDFYMFSKMNGTVLLEDATSTNFWGFGFYVPSSPNRPTLPGPTLIIDEGDTVNIHFRNLSLEMHTIHLHGLDVDQLNDGVPATSYAVVYNDSTVYTFVAKNTGSFLYHCHVETVHHLAMGMYGMIVVRNKPNPNQLFDSGPGFNKEYLFLGSEMDRAWNDFPLAPGPFNLYAANYFMINGFSGAQLFTDSTNVINAQVNDSIVLRLGSMSYGYQKYTFPTGLNAKVYMSDGRPLPTPFSSDTLRIYPGERYEVVLKPTTLVNDYITVDYHNCNNETYMGTNYIGVNMYVPVGIADNKTANGFRIFPNPANELLYFMNDDVRNTEAIIYSINGAEVLKTKIVLGKNTLDVSNLNSGMYLLRSKSGFAKFVITK